MARFLAVIAFAFAGAAFAAQTPLVDVAQLSARAGHGCVVTNAGGVKCWGSNSSGQLGGGLANTSRPAATDVVGLTSGAVQVAASLGAHSCAIVTGGGVKCWGSNSAGQLGDGTTTDRLTPVDVQSLPWPAVAISAGNAHTCALSSAGAVACWGNNFGGQLGDGTTENRLAPTPVSGLSAGVVAISAGMFHTCAILSGGAAKCWGSNISGALGDGTTQQRSTPVDVIGLGSGVTHVDASGTPGAMFIPERGYTCAIASGIAKCWGGTLGSAGTPADVAGIAPGASAISYGGGMYVILRTPQYKTHACVITAGGGARCWGSNWCGIIGDGQPPNCGQLEFPTLPATDVVGLSSGVVAIQAAHFHSCALLADGQVKCWGSGYGSTPIPKMAGTSPQTIYFSPAPLVAIGGNGTLTATGGGSGNPIVFSSLTPGTCSVSGSTVTGIAVGSCTIAANQAGDQYYDAATEATLTFDLDPRLGQEITLGPAPSVVVNGVGSIIATSTSGLPVALSTFTGSCTVSGAVVTGTSVGTCYIEAQQSGNSVYAPAPWKTLQFQVTQNLGTYGLVVSKSGLGTGTVTSSPGGLDCGFICAGNLAVASTVTLTPAADAMSTFDGWSGACLGMGPCTVSMDGFRTVSARFNSNIVRLANISTRARVLTGNEVMIGGFVIGGSTPKKIVVRARGLSLYPQLPAHELLADPLLQIFSGSTQIATNDNFAAQSQASLAELYASGFAPGSALDAAIITTLAPGPYTAIVTGTNGTTGVGLVEIFEVDRPETPLINISTRGKVQTGDNVMIAGFIIQGYSPQTVVVRARGPSLTATGVPGVLANPKLQLFSGQTQIAANDNWQDAANAAAIQASGFAPADAAESAILITLDPGAYTAIVSGVAGTVGAAIVEVFKN